MNLKTYYISKFCFSSLLEIKKPFKLIYNKDLVKIASVVKFFSLDYQKRSPFTGRSEVEVDIYNRAVKRRSNMEIHAKNTDLSNTPFVMEWDYGPKCFERKLSGLEIYKCFGYIILRRFDKHLDSQLAE